MLEFSTLALLVSSITLAIHYHQHFRSHYWGSNRKKKRRSATSKPIDFFPLSCMYYIIFVIFLTINIVVIEILYAFKYKEYKKAHLFIFTVHTDDLYYIDNSVNHIHELTVIHVFDYMAVYAIMILSLWASLHSFYRYYTVYSSVCKLQTCQPSDVLRVFSLYAIIYGIIYVITIHYCYLAFIMVISIHCFFNLYCNFKCTRLLYQRYKAFANGSNRQSRHSNTILHSVRYMQLTSCICCILQTSYLIVFLATYNIITLLILPVVWTTSCVLFCSQFVKNRNYVHSVVSYCKMCPCRHSQMAVALCSMEIHIENNDTPNSTAAGNVKPNHTSNPNEEAKQSTHLNEPNQLTNIEIIVLSRSAPVSAKDYEQTYSFASTAGHNSLKPLKLQYCASADLESRISNKRIARFNCEKQRMKQAMYTLDTWTKHGFCDRANFDVMKEINTPLPQSTNELFR